jgi:hypothetical protein
MNNLQEISISPCAKHSVVSTVPQSPNQSTRIYSDLCLSYFMVVATTIYSVKSIQKLIVRPVTEIRVLLELMTIVLLIWLRELW